MEGTRHSVLTIGGAMIDTIALIDSDRIERMSMNNADKAFLLLEEGRKTEALSISTHPGGGAINAAVSFARLGFKAASLVKVGRDARADAIETALRREIVSCDYIKRTDDAATGASVLISSHDRNAAVFTFRGANSFLVEDDFARTTFDCDIVYVAGLSDRSADVFPLAVRLAVEAGAFVAANPGIRQLAARGEAFQQTLPHLGLLSMNRDEAAALVPRLTAQHQSPAKQSIPADAPELLRRGLSSSGFDMGFPQFLEAILGFGVGCVLITDGRHGAYAADTSGIVYCPSLPVDVVGTAGAGDAFTSTFTGYIANGTSIPDAMQYATLNASSVVTYPDTQSGLLTRSALAAAKTAKALNLPIQTWSFNA